MRTPNWRRLFNPPKRLGLVALVYDSAAASALLALQLRAHDLGASALERGLLGMLPQFSGLGMSLLSGRLSDRWGRRRTELLAFSINIITWVGMAYAATTSQLLVLAALTGLGFGCVWAPLAAWIGDLSGGNERLLARYLGYYNVGWSAGLMVGPLLAGGLWDIFPRQAFLVPAWLGLVCMALVCTTPQPPHLRATTSSAAAGADYRWLRIFLAMAWAGGFAACFGRGVVGAMFPGLGRELGYSAWLIGMVTFCSAAGETLTFILQRFTRRWDYSVGLQVWTMVLGGLAMAIAAWTSSPVVFGVCFAVMGAALGVTYAAGIRTALQVSDAAGRLAGFNEAVFGGGLVMGPLLGALAAQFWHLRVSFTVSAEVCGLVIVAQLGLWLWSRSPRRQA